ncbi:hypothetical protein [Marasmitruncus massiliensis]|uniref:hypothetical protein n=1 Tax=Marasmitruncus massiliensis TaxID=1944642 RepID=UPI000C7973CB|nr:hypothetical protein [Marasmitruncus massiliensis]
MVLRQKRRVHIVPIVLFSVLLAGILAAAIYYFYFFHSTASGNLIQKQFQVENLDPDAKNGRLPGVPKDEKSPGEGMFSYRINPTPVFQSNGSGGDIKVQNPSFNRYLMVLEITVDGTDGTVYRSQYIAPNQYISSIDLQKQLPSGEYRATAYLNAVDAGTLDLVDTLTCPLEITVK